MRFAALQRLILLAPLWVMAVARADDRQEDSLRSGINFKIFHHLIPGLRLSARPLTPPAPLRPAENKNVMRAGWPAFCAEPVRVSFYGDFWVPPYGPAAQAKHQLLEPLRPLLGWADFNVVNFEGSITKETVRAYPKFPFALKQAPESLSWLSAAGVKYFTRANNHSMDFGWAGAAETSAAMKKAGLHFSGIGENLDDALKPMWLEKNDVKIAVFSATTTYPSEAWAGQGKKGVAHPTSGRLRQAVAKVRDEADFVVVVFHWGDELKAGIKPHQQDYARQVLAAGADIVVGHHAHLAQKIDSSAQDGMIVYGIGNFIFSSLSRDARFGLGSHVEFCRSPEADALGATHAFRAVFSPLLTDNRQTGYRSRPMSLNEFLPFAREYVKNGHFSPDLEFYLHSEGEVRTIGEWLQRRPQASKEGRAVN